MARLVLELDDLLLADLADAAEGENQSIEQWVLKTIENRLEAKEVEGK